MQIINILINNLIKMQIINISINNLIKNVNNAFKWFICFGFYHYVFNVYMCIIILVQVLHDFFIHI